MNILGIDAGATWIKAGRFGAEGTLEKSITVASGAPLGVTAYLDSIAAAAGQLGGAAMIGLSVPGTFTRDGNAIRYTANVKGLTLADDTKPLSIGEALAKRLHTVKIAADNDASCAALAEWQHRQASASAPLSLLQLTWGTGIGTAFVIDGKAQYGWEGGHMPVSWNERSDIACNCGSARDLEAYCAVPHLVRRAGLQPEELLVAAQAGEEKPGRVIQDALQWLARGLHTMSVLVYPDVVAIGGGFMASDWLLEQLRQHVQRVAVGYLVDTLRPDMVQRAQLGNNAGMIGAALLARQRFG